MSNEGKLFEQDIKDSMPEDAFCYRLRDSSGAWGKNANTRFTPKNICDYMVFRNGSLHLLELKSHKGKSLPLSCINMKNLEEMLTAQKYQRVYSAIVVNFRDHNVTYSLPAHFVSYYMRNFPDKKSIPLEWFKSNGRLIYQEQKRTRWKYTLVHLLS